MHIYAYVYIPNIVYRDVYRIYTYIWKKIDNKVIQVEGKIYWEAKSTL